MKESEGPRATHIFDEVNDLQHRLTEMYNSAANNASDPTLKQDLLSLLMDEHSIQGEILQVMRRRGMHIPPPASKDEIVKVRDNFNH